MIFAEAELQDIVVGVESWMMNAVLGSWRQNEILKVITT